MKMNHYLLHNLRSIPDIIKSAFYCPALPSSPASLQIIQHPKDGSASTGNIKFSVVVNRKDVTYQWQVSTPANPAWATSYAPNAKTNTIEIGATADRNGQKYRCMITAADGTVVISNAATMTVV